MLATTMLLTQFECSSTGVTAQLLQQIVQVVARSGQCACVGDRLALVVLFEFNGTDTAQFLPCIHSRGVEDIEDILIRFLNKVPSRLDIRAFKVLAESTANAPQVGDPS